MLETEPATSTEELPLLIRTAPATVDIDRWRWHRTTTDDFGKNCRFDPTPHYVIDSKSAMLAGIIAGTAATAAEILLWWTTGAPLSDMLVRDSRLAAAIVMSERALAATPLFDWSVMAAATVVHFGLSIVYAIALAVIVGGLGVAAAIATGVAFGGLLYLINMYGFTFVFPWFVATRDWITFAAHLVFGATAGGVYAVVRRGSIGVR